MPDLIRHPREIAGQARNDVVKCARTRFFIESAHTSIREIAGQARNDEVDARNDEVDVRNDDVISLQ